jgi:DNA-binding beta-propeller fold protein YncE
LTALGDKADFYAGNRFVHFRPQDNYSNSMILKPYDLFLAGNKLYLCDTKRNGLWVLDVRHRIKRYVRLKLGIKSKLVNLAQDNKRGIIYMVDMGQNRLLIKDRQDKLIDSFDKVGKPIDVAVYKDMVYILDIEEETVQVWDKDFTNLVRKIGKPGDRAGEFHMPSSITIDDGGFLYVTDTGNARIQKFRSNGKFLMSIGQPGDTPGCFVRPKGVAVDKKGNVYVVDAMLQNVQLFDLEGNLLMYFGKVPVGDINLKLPAKITLDYDHVDSFRAFAEPDFELEYLILVSNQIGPNKVNVYGFGRQKIYPADTAK